MSDPGLSFSGYTFDRPSLADVDGVFAVDSDPEVWRHSPHHRQETRAETREAIERSMRRWAADGLDYWVIHDPTGRVVGMAGPRLMRGYWNLYARLAPAAQGRGLATATQRAAIAAAQAHSPSLPIVGRLRTSNDASRRLVDRLGLTFQLEGPAEDDGVGWFIYADRPLDAELRRRFST